MTSNAKLLLRAILILLAIPLFGWIGMGAGNFIPYRLAEWTDRDIAELKELLIWSMLVHTALFAVLGAWLVFVLTKAGRIARFSVLGVAAFIALAGIAVALTAYPWPKDSGNPIVRYELRLPPNAPEPEPGTGGYDLTLWNEKSGHGAYIEQVRRAGDRAEIKGDFTLYKDRPAPTMALRLRGMEGHWRVPYDGTAKLEKQFGDWQKIEFIPTPREGVAPLPQGNYEIRYWVKRYL